MTDEQQRELRQLMAEAQNGDQDSYVRLLKLCREILKTFLRGRLSDREALEDLVQDVLLSIHKARHSYDTSKPFAPWFFAIARSRLCDYLRKHRHDKLFDSKNMDRVADYREAKYTEGGENLLRSLPEKQRRVVTLLKLEDLSVREVSQALKMSESSVKVTAHRAYTALRKQYE